MVCVHIVIQVHTPTYTLQFHCKQQQQVFYVLRSSLITVIISKKIAYAKVVNTL